MRVVILSVPFIGVGVGWFSRCCAGNDPRH